MPDAIQHSVQALAAQNTVARNLTIFCAVALVYLLGVAWVLVVVRQRATLTLATVGRLVVLGLLASLLSKLLAHVVIDPRPYVVAHMRPLIPVARDNGFPSDHALLAAFLATGLWWIDRRLLPAFAVGTVLVLLGRLGVGAHHTIDVLGSIGIVAVAALGTLAIPLPSTFHRPLFPPRERPDHVAKGG
jgi:membrane-associated phospholipid phosphatase